MEQPHHHLPQQALDLLKRAKVHVPRRHRERDADFHLGHSQSTGSDSHKTYSGFTGRLLSLERTETGGTTIGRFTLRGKNDDLPQTWWFASTAIPLLAATIGPMANVLSIAALATSWRAELPNNGELPAGVDAQGVGIADPKWELVLNAMSLACGFAGNFFLLLNFEKRVRYIIALPLTILLWFMATGILTSIVIAIHVYDPPISPGETYSQGFWHAVLASILYMFGSIILMVNMLGYFLGHYPQHFELDDSQRTLILQTMMFFFWLAGGAGIFTRLAGFSYADALYFCDVTVLTIGFGDFTSPNDGGRGFVFPYTVIGIIFLGLMINSIRKFASSMSRDKVIKAHQLHERERTVGRTVTSENELRERLGLPRRPSDARRNSKIENLIRKDRLDSLSQYGHFKMEGRAVTFHEHRAHAHGGGRGGAGRTAVPKKALSRDEKIRARANSGGAKQRRADRRRKLLLLKEEKDRFEAMREIQKNTQKFKQYYALGVSVFAFSVLWCVGALVFMLAEKREQDMTYFQALYFCYVSLLTIGYGDFSPKSNVGKPFFVVWSLIAVPTMTILISDMSDTVVAAINRGTFTVADWTVMPREGAWHDFLEAHPRIKEWIRKRNADIQSKKRVRQGFDVADPDMDIRGDEVGSDPAPPTLEELAEQNSLSHHELARKLALTIKRTAKELHFDPPKKYGYEEWVEFTRLIRFSAVKDDEELEDEEEVEGIVNWDWIGEDSPMLSDLTEPEWILERLCESLNRYTRRQAKLVKQHHDTVATLKRDSKPRTSMEKYGFESPDPVEDDELEIKASGSGSSSVESSNSANVEGRGRSGRNRKMQPRHWRGIDLDRDGHVTGLNHESQAVREWEDRIARARARDDEREKEKEADGEGVDACDEKRGQVDVAVAEGQDGDGPGEDEIEVIQSNQHL